MYVFMSSYLYIYTDTCMCTHTVLHYLIGRQTIIGLCAGTEMFIHPIQIFAPLFVVIYWTLTRIAYSLLNLLCLLCIYTDINIYS